MARQPAPSQPTFPGMCELSDCLSAVELHAESFRVTSQALLAKLKHAGV